MVHQGPSKEELYSGFSVEELRDKLQAQWLHFSGLSMKLQKDPQHPKREKWEVELFHLDKVAIPLVRKLLVAKNGGGAQ